MWIVTRMIETLCITFFTSFTIYYCISFTEKSFREVRDNKGYIISKPLYTGFTTPTLDLFKTAPPRLITIKRK